MKKSFLLILMVMTIGLAGCLPQATAVPTATLEPTPTIAPSPKPTTGLSIPTGSEILPEPDCTVVTQKPTPGPTPEPIYPPITDADHTKGPASAKVTIVEYSDFQ